MYNGSTGKLQGSTSTDRDTNPRVIITVTDLILAWHHVSIRACGSSNYSRFCIREWGGSLD